MRWADALKASVDKRAMRPLKDAGDRTEPNVLLIDPRFNKAIPKAFHATENYAWGRVPLRKADDYDDWTPATIRQAATPWETT